MIDKNKINKTLYFDIEVVSEYDNIETFKITEPSYYKHWEKIVSKYKETENWSLEDENNAYIKYAPLYAEFSKIISIAFGTTKYVSDDVSINIKSISSVNELDLLKSFSNVLAKAYSANSDEILCGHNIIEYDIPFLIKRFIKNGITIPNLLRKTIDAKPWELNVLDTIKFWKFNGQRFASLSLITDFLKIESPKSDIDGSMVNPLFWKSSDKTEILERIGKYNEADVKATIDLVLKLASL